MPSPHSAQTMRLALVSRQLFRRDRDLHPLLAKQILVRHLAVGEHLLLVFALDLGVHLARQGLRAFFGGDANRSSGRKIDNVAATLPQSRNFSARLPRRHPVTTATASVAQRSISTKVMRRLRSCRRDRRCPGVRGRASPGARQEPVQRRDGREPLQHRAAIRPDSSNVLRTIRQTRCRPSGRQTGRLRSP